MEKGTSKNVACFLRVIGADERENISDFCHACSSRKFNVFDDPLVAVAFTSHKYSEEESAILRDYSGFYYKWINAVARGNWDYEVHGHIVNKAKYENAPRVLQKIIDQNQKSIGNVKVFRVVPLSYFSEYGISSLNDLKSLEGSFLLDKGFVSTSLVEESCYYRKPNELGLNYNVKIEYLVPEEFEDGVSIGNVSYSPGQSEYLINVWNIAQVVDVSMDGNDGAIVRALLVPKRVYDKTYRQQRGNVK